MLLTWAAVPSRMSPSMTLVTAVGAGPPWAGENLMPFHSGGLWLAVMVMPPPRWPALMAKLTTGVGVSRNVKKAGMPLPAMISAAVVAKVSERNRVS